VALDDGQAFFPVAGIDEPAAALTGMVFALAPAGGNPWLLAVEISGLAAAGMRIGTAVDSDLVAAGAGTLVAPGPSMAPDDG
jgi:hypothetical protein